MVLNRPIPGQTFIAGEFARTLASPKPAANAVQKGTLQPRANPSAASTVNSLAIARTTVLFRPCRVCLADSHPTPQCPYIYYSSNVLFVKVSASSYLQAAERGKQAEEIKRQQAEEERGRKERERERKEKERAEREREERKKQERKERERKEKEKEDRRERERRDHERQDRKERDRKDRHHRRREDQADSGDERRKGSKEDRRRDRDYDRSGRDRSSHRYSHASSSESEDDGDRGWIKVTRKKSRSY